jgi:hypothetical protein
MSVSVYVFMAGNRVPSIDAWQDAAQRSGISLTFDPKTQLASHEGFLPVRHDDQSTGFEFFIGRASDMLGDYPQESYPELHTKLAGRDAVTVFTWHSDAKEGVAANYAAAVFAQLADGVLFDPEAGDVIQTNDALEHARAFAAEMERFS